VWERAPGCRWSARVAAAYAPGTGKPDRQTQSEPSLPSGHPFSNIQTGPTSNYWSASTIAGNTGFAWAVWFGSGVVVFADKTTNNTLFAWCARSGHPGPDGQ
jgi:hypothetical protein